MSAAASLRSATSSQRAYEHRRPSDDSSLAGAAPAPPQLQPATSPTIYVYYSNRSVKARIDREVPLDEIIRQLAASTQLQVAEPASQFALREKETGDLVTEDTLSRYLERGHAFNLCPSPSLEASQMVDKLLSFDAATLKLATFSLRNLIKERAFLDEFLRRGGLEALQEVIKRATGNTLAYSLLSLQTLMDLEERGWEGLEDGFVARIVEIIATEPLINISRPATALLRRLSLIAPPLSFADTASIDSSLSNPPSVAPPAGSGFAAVWREIEKQPDFLKIVVGRLASGDVEVVDLSLGLVNSLFRGATEIGDHRFGDELERLEGWKAIGKLLETRRSATSDLTPILAFQTNLLASLHSQLLTPISEAHYHLFDEIWAASSLEEAGGEDAYRWRRLGFDSENPQYEFESTGVLGLKALARFAGEPTNEFGASLLETLSRPADRRCPLSAVSTTVLSLLSTHFSIDSGVSPTPTKPNPFLLRFFECHALATQFFFRIWSESGATMGDFERVKTLTASQVRSTLGGVGGEEKTWFRVRQEFLHADYKTIRDRQMQEMATEDDTLNKAPVRHLRGRLYLESYEFVRSQRISCLHEGAWFLVPSSQPTGKKDKHAQGKIWRFYRLAANRKVLHFVESNERGPVRPGLDDLPERIDLALVTDVVPATSPSTNAPSSHPKRSFSIATGASPPTHRRTHSAASSHTLQSTHTMPPPTTSNAPSASTNLTFSLLSADGLLCSLTAPSPDVYSEWIDGLSLLRTDGNICTKETADYVHALTEIGLKVKLLDITGERVEIPSGLVVAGVPASQDFVYSDSM
ncbi:ELMO/CED-12 family-domain-containing protein [Leucosporidium creatinivorum]|uniref:ELMO/CED-12 family-domain-containing protein n=1 Tax=Leucosporidium creatinivorum TaxID=106004 RepID=A0A1Y2DWM9_9BASI|nr:ELMO/CED-12 family-domain-containing protein [Leucosporidium creatinivorum]